MRGAPRRRPPGPAALLHNRRGGAWASASDGAQYTTRFHSGPPGPPMKENLARGMPLLKESCCAPSCSVALSSQKQSSPQRGASP